MLNNTSKFSMPLCPSTCCSLCLEHPSLSPCLEPPLVLQLSAPCLPHTFSQAFTSLHSALHRTTADIALHVHGIVSIWQQKVVSPVFVLVPGSVT